MLGIGRRPEFVLALASCALVTLMTLAMVSPVSAVAQDREALGPTPFVAETPDGGSQSGHDAVSPNAETIRRALHDVDRALLQVDTVVEQLEDEIAQTLSELASAETSDAAAQLERLLDEQNRQLGRLNNLREEIMTQRTELQSVLDTLLGANAIPDEPPVDAAPQ